MYRLECGVKEGKLISPPFFNQYMNELNGELSKTNLGCHVDGIWINNIGYADDMIFLNPSISAMRRLLHICEEYIKRQGYNNYKIKSVYTHI